MRSPLCCRPRTTQAVLAACFVTLALLAPAARAAFQSSAIAQLDLAITSAVAGKQTPGAVVWLEHGGDVYEKAYGLRAAQPASEPMTADTIFDVASLTKVLATAPAVLLLIERGQVKLDDPLQRHLPEFKGKGAEAVTLRHLLTHTSGLLAGIGGADFHDAAGALAVALRERPHAPPGTEFHYCDLNFILLAEVVQRVAKEPFQAFVARELYQPLRMTNTCFLPPERLRARIAPTQRLAGSVLRGVVHDPTARRMGGVAGHAGVFSTAADIARFARMMLNEGELEGVRIFQPETIRLMTSVQSPTPVLARRGLGWDMDSGYSRPRGLVFPLGSYGHTGFTGALLWIDPFSKTLVVLLTNRTHPDGKGNVAELYAIAGTLAARAVADFDFQNVPGALPFRTNFIMNWGGATNYLKL